MFSRRSLFVKALEASFSAVGLAGLLAIRGPDPRLTITLEWVHKNGVSRPTQVFRLDGDPGQIAQFAAAVQDEVWPEWREHQPSADFYRHYSDYVRKNGGGCVHAGNPVWRAAAEKVAKRWGVKIDNPHGLPGEVK